MVEFNTIILIDLPHGYASSDMCYRYDATRNAGELTEIEYFMDFWDSSLDDITLFIASEEEHVDANRGREANIPIDESKNLTWINLIKRSFCDHASLEFDESGMIDREFDKRVRNYCDLFSRNIDDLVEMSRIVRFSMECLGEEAVKDDYVFGKFLEFEKMLCDESCLSDK